MNQPFLSTFSSRPAVAAGVLLAAEMLAGGLSAALAQQPPSQYRSLTDVRERIPDEHDRPYFRETQTHRGFEVREPQFTIVAETSAADARWAASQVAQGWQQAAHLADRWTTAHQKPDFGLSALQVVISSEPLRERDAPLTTVNVVGIQTQVQINVAPGQPGLPQQVARLREGAAFAMLHAAGVDSAAPPWVVEGLAAVAGRAGLNEDDLKNNDLTDRAARLGGQQWRYARAADDALAYPMVDHEQAAAQMAFLLKADDAQRAPQVFAALAQATASADQAAARGDGFATLPGNSQLPVPGSLDGMLTDLHDKFVQWQQNPAAGQPLYEPAPDAPPDRIALEREMVLLLKLHRRVTAAAAAAPTSRDDRLLGPETPVRTKIITFDRTKGMAVREPARPASSPPSFSKLADYLSNPAAPPWATIDVDGSVLLSTDAARLSALLANQAHYRLENSPAGAVLVRQLSSGQTIRGWLADNPQDKSRPLVRFELANSNRRIKTIELPQTGARVTVSGR